MFNIQEIMNANTENNRGVVLELQDKFMSASDRLYLENILKRQYYVLRDLYQLHDSNPSLIDIDLVSGLDGIFRAMHDMSESITYRKKQING